MSIVQLIKRPIKYLLYLNKKRKFGLLGRHSSIGKPLRLTCPQNIYIEDNVGIAPYAWLAAEPH